EAGHPSARGFPHPCERRGIRYSWGRSAAARDADRACGDAAHGTARSKEGHVIRSTRTHDLGGALLVLLGLLTPGRALSATHQDPNALTVVAAVEKTNAPDNGWSKAGGLRFTFSVVKDDETVAEIHHSWNVQSGQYRVDWKTKEGDQRMALFNVGAKGKQGEAYMRLNAVSTGQASMATPDGKAPPVHKPRPDVIGWRRTPTTMAPQILESVVGRIRQA